MDNVTKVLAMVALIPAIILLTAVVGAVFVYFGWNGCHALFGVREITFIESFWLSMLARSLLTVSNTGK